MRRKPYTPPGSTPALLASMGAGVLYALAQPNWGAWPLAACAVSPLVWALQGAGTGRRVLRAWVFATVATALATAVAGTTGAVAYFGLPVWQGVASALAAGQVFGGGSFVLFAWLAGDPARGHPAAAVLRVGAAWGAAELVRCIALTGLPWMLFAYALTPVPALAQTASLGGAFLVSMWLAAWNAALALALLGPRRRAARGSGLATLGVIAGLTLIAAHEPEAEAGGGVPGAVRTAPATGATDEAALRVLLVQGRVPDAWRGTPGNTRLAAQRLVELTRGVPEVDLALWPENAVNAVLPFNQRLLQEETAPLWESVDHLMLGAPRGDPARPGVLRNSALLLGPDAEVRGAYDKVHLLPFAEYDPWPWSLVHRSRLTTASGRAPVVLQASGTGLGPLICYEVLFADLARVLVRDGAGLLVNLSNDSWFGTTGALEQHFAAAVFRAIETRRPVLRATNTGITAAIDARGRVVARLALNRPGAVLVEVRPGTVVSPYLRIGDALPWTVLLVCLGLSVREALPGRRWLRAARGG